jgi:hypothetical protein
MTSLERARRSGFERPEGTGCAPYIGGHPLSLRDVSRPVFRSNRPSGRIASSSVAIRAISPHRNKPEVGP